MIRSGQLVIGLIGAMLLFGSELVEGKVAEFELERSLNARDWEKVPVDPESLNYAGKVYLPPEGSPGFYRLRLLTVGDGFTRIPAGAYSRGDHFDEQDMEASRPVHEVYVSEFYIAQYPVRYDEWREVYDWAIENGYEFENPGQRGSKLDFEPFRDLARYDRHPVLAVSWHDVVKWCNARSEKEELTPVYYTDEDRTLVYREGQHDVSNEEVRWDADGYRLPTEAEWEKAARGGLEGKRWPWGDEDIDGDRACFARREGGTLAVGSFPANEFGLYDMAGKVFEWCWDVYESDWYGEEEASEPDTRGPTSGISRTIRGGSWWHHESMARVARREMEWATSARFQIGFRVVRSK